MGTLTQKQVQHAQLPEGKKEHYLQDGDNLVLRLRLLKRGISKAWQFRYTRAGKRESIHIGNFPEVGLADAREKAAEYRRQLAQGIDPAAELAKAKAESVAAALAKKHGDAPTTLSELLYRWQQNYLRKRHADGGAAIVSLFELHVFPLAGAIKPDLLRPAHLRTVLDEMHDKGLTRSCGQVLSTMRQIYHFAFPLEWMSIDPTMGLQVSDWDGRGKIRERFLAQQDIKELYKKLKASDLGDRWTAAILLILACGTRVEETLLAERAHVDLEASTWLIPLENQKKTREKEPRDFTVYLSAAARKQMQILLGLPGSNIYLFPARLRKGDSKGIRPCNEKTLTHLIKDRTRGTALKGRSRASNSLLLKSGSWTPHDLRRTMSSTMQELEIDADVIDKCQNHSIVGRVRKTYLQAPLQNAMRNAWSKYGDLLEQLYAEAEEEFRQEEGLKAKQKVKVAAREAFDYGDGDYI